MENTDTTVNLSEVEATILDAAKAEWVGSGEPAEFVLDTAAQYGETVSEEFVTYASVQLRHADSGQPTEGQPTDSGT